MGKDKQLKQYFCQNPVKLSPADWADITKLLIKAEAATGGPYYDSDGKISWKFNQNIAKLLASQKIYLPSLIKFAGPTFRGTKKSNNKIRPKTERGLFLLKSKIESLVSNNFKKLPQPLKKISLNYWQKFSQKKIIFEIIGLPYYCYLSRKNKSKKDLNLLKKLSSANIYLWIAYTIYDDIIDDQKNIKLLPLANFCFREYLFALTTSTKNNQKLFNLIKNIADTTDNAIGAEALRLNYKPENKSLSHLITGLILATENEAVINTIYFEDLFSGLKKYLRARQLSDDLKDLEEDFRSGRITEFTKNLKSSPAKNNSERQLMLLTGFETKIQKIISTSRKKLSKSDLLRPEYIEKLLEPLDVQCQNFFRQRADIKKFFNTWEDRHQKI